ncbi:hypothetical protein [Stenotrophomonas sp. SMYL20]|uniref:hypothetical protein n=1 Tax=Stenotrophomonas sp. SMYL20 TaxID=3076043 RepID=UPI002E7AA31F|nr:hypothetical protein [Stenotrophomonas sp. SMYL20]
MALHSSEGRSLSMVVDCGGSTAKHRKLLAEAFAARARSHDFLAISHLDDDHINGLEDLKNAGVSFRTVFLPHVDISNYLQWMTLRLSSRVRAGSLLADFARVATLLYGGSFGQVVIVGGPDGDEGPERDRVFKGNTDRADVLSNETHQAIERAKVGRSRFSCSTSLTFDLDWLIRFYSREWKFPKEVSSIWSLQILQDLQNVLSKAGGNLNSAEWTDFSLVLKSELKRRADPSLAAELISLVPPTDQRAPALAKLGNAVATTNVSCKKLLSALYGIFSSLHDYNDASLCVYSGPAERGIGARRQCFDRRVHSGVLAKGFPTRATTRAVGWIHTGDANLSDKDRLDDFLDHYLAETPLTSTLVLPHHGSRRSFDKHLNRLRELAAGLANPTVFLAPAEPHGKFHHPDGDVVHACHHLGDLAIVDKDAISCYSESVTTGWLWSHYW